MPMERVKSLQSGFGSCFLELWKRFCPLSEWTLLSETLWRLKTDSTENILSPKRAYFNFLKNFFKYVYGSFFKKSNAIWGKTLWQYASSCQRKLFIGLSHVSGFLFPAVISDITIQNFNLSSPSNLIYNSVLNFIRNHLWIKTQE